MRRAVTATADQEGAEQARATAPAPSNPAAVLPLGRCATTASERITAGPGTATGTWLWFSRDVAAHAVTNSTNRDA